MIHGKINLLKEQRKRFLPLVLQFLFCVHPGIGLYSFAFLSSFCLQSLQQRVLDEQTLE